MKKLMLESLFSMIFIQQLFSVDTNAVRYFPMHIGNTYVYNETIWRSGVPNRDTIITGMVTRDTIVMGHRYFFISGIPHLLTNFWYRVDTLTGSLFRFDPGNTCSYYISETFTDSLAAEEGNEIKFCGLSGGFFYRCYVIDTLILFNIQSFKKIFLKQVYQGGYSSITYTNYARNFGIYFDRNDYTAPNGAGGSMRVLKGCVINGSVYGDTSKLMGIYHYNNEVPVDFNLFQNYPNPFNPTTTIKFDLPKASKINLVICDMLGRELYTISNQYLNSGSYLYTWDAGKYASGVYLYRLTAGEYSETRKMILVK